jgi:ABC-type nitrate/sulfonate/bicarbonate transport system substrate-binding protein
MEMSAANLTVMYGHLEGAGRDFARDPTGYLSIAAGIFHKHGLEVSWQHVQGTEERYRRLENGSAQLSLLVGRASLQHFLTSKTTRILGVAMNSCPYYLIASPSISRLADLRGKIVVCREGPSRDTPIAETFEEKAQLRVGNDLQLQLVNGDQDAFESLVSGKTQGALLPRPFGFIAEEKGFKRIAEWPDVVDDPLPITIETTVGLFRDREKDFAAFLAAHSEGIRHFKSHRADALRILTKQFGHAQTLAEKTLDDYVTCMSEGLKVDYRHFERLLSQVAPGQSANARQVASEWIAAGALTG